MNRLVDIDLNNHELTGDVNINSQDTGTVNISEGNITGNLTVDASNATVNNAASVSGTITITDVATGTWNENANGNKIVVDDKTGITLNIGANNTVSSLTLNQPATVTISEGSTVKTLNINSAAKSSEITNNGEIEKFEGTAPETLEGSGTVAIDGSNVINITTNNDSKVSVKTTLPNNLKISQIDSLAVSLLNDTGEILTTNTLNDLGHFLHGTEANSFDEKFQKKLVVGNVDYWKGVYDNIDGAPQIEEWEAGVTIQHPSAGDINSISTSFIQRDTDLDGMANLESTSAWDQGKFSFVNPSQIQVKYKKNGLTYKAIKDVK